MKNPHSSTKLSSSHPCFSVMMMMTMRKLRRGQGCALAAAADDDDDNNNECGVDDMSKRLSGSV